MSAALGQQVKRFQETERRWASPWFHLDPLLLAATVALIACGVYVVGTATPHDTTTSPDHRVISITRS